MARIVSVAQNRHRVSPHRRRSALWAAVLAGSLLAPALAQANNVYWDGFGSSWSSSSNWTTDPTGNTISGVAPTTGDIATFSTSSVTFNQVLALDAGESVAGLLFQNSVYTVSIGPDFPSLNTLTLGTSGITVNSGAGAVTLADPLALSAAQTWTNNSTLTISGNVANGGNGLIFAGTGNTTVSGVIAGSGTLTLNGTGVVTFSNANTYSGFTTVDSTLLVANGTNGSATGTLQVIVASGGTLAAAATPDGTTPGGTITGLVSISSGGYLTPHPDSMTIGVLKTGNLSLANGSFLNFNVGATADEVQAANVALSSTRGTVTLNINALSGLTLGTYELFSYSGTLSGRFANLSIGANNGSQAFSYSLSSATAQEITLVVASKPILTWSAAHSTTWDTITANWNPGTVSFSTGSPVLFDDTASAPAHTVTLSGPLTPLSVVVNTSSTYVFSGNGSLADASPSAPMTLAMNGTGKLSIGSNVANTFTGGTTINAGTIAVTTSTSLGAITGALTINAGTLEVTTNITDTRAITLANAASAISVDSGKVYTTSGILSGSGALNATGLGTLTLTGANNFTGQTIIQAGTVSIGAFAAVGTAQPLGTNANPVVIGSSTPSTATLAYTGASTSTTVPIAIGSGGGTIAVIMPANTLTLTGAVAGGPLTAKGPGKLLLSGTNTYAATNITGGTVQVANTGTLGSGTVTLSGGAVLHFTGVTGGGAVPMPTAQTAYVCSSSWTNNSQNPATIGTGGAWQVGANGGTGNGSAGQPDFVFVSLGSNYNLAQVTINWNEAAVNPENYAFYTAPASAPITSLYTSPLNTNNPTGALGGATAPNTVNLANWTLDSAQFTVTPPAGSVTYALNGNIAGYLLLYSTQRGPNGYGFTIIQMSLNQPAAVSQTIASLSTSDPTSQVSLDGGVTLNVGSDNTSTTFAGTITGGGTLGKIGSGVLTLTGNNNYAGGTVIANGTIRAGADGAVVGSGTVTFGSSTPTAGTLDLNGHNVQVSGLVVATGATAGSQIIGNSSTTSPATLTLTGGNASSFGGVIQDTLGSGNQTVAVVMGNGTLALTGANTYSGGTTVSGGTLVINNNAALGSGALNMNGGTLDSTLAGITLANNPMNWNGNFAFTGTQSLNLGTGAVTLGTTPTITVTANTLTVGGVISGPQGIALTGAGTLVLSAANNYTGGTFVTGGTLSVTGTLGSTTINVNGGTLALNGTGAVNQNTLMVSGTGILTQSVPNAISNTAALIVVGSSVTLATPNNYSGGTTLSGGTLVINNNAALGSGALTISGGTLDSQVAGITLPNNPMNWNGNFAFTGSQSLNLGSGAVTLGASPTVTVAANTLTVGGAIGDGGNGFGITLAGAGTLALSGASTYTGATSVTAGTLSVTGTLGNTPVSSSFEEYVAATGNDQNSRFADPRFVDPEAHDFHLQPDSPARNGGDDLGSATVGDQDIDGRPRVREKKIDIGCYETP